MKYILSCFFLFNIFIDGYQQTYHHIELRKPIKYYQGIYLDDKFKLYLGTNRGDVHCFLKNKEVEHVWSRNLYHQMPKQIRGCSEYLMVYTEPLIIDKTGNTYIIHKNSTNILRRYEWNTNTLMNEMTDNYIYIRCDYHGNIFTQHIETGHIKEYSLNITDDIILSMIYHDMHLYAITMNKYLIVFNMDENEIYLKDHLEKCNIGTSICIRNFGSRSLFVYIGDISGNIHFYQYENTTRIFEKTKWVSSHPIIDIKYNEYSLIIGNTKGEILGIESLTFSLFMKIPVQYNFYKDTDNFFLRENVIFTYHFNDGVRLIKF